MAIAAVVELGFGEPVRSLGETMQQPMIVGGAGLIPASASNIGLATSIAIFALNGYGAAVYFGEDMVDARQRIARAVLAALALTLLLETLPLLATLVGAPDLPTLLAADDPFGMLVTERAGQSAADWVAVGVVIAIVNSVIAWTAACARFFYSSGRDACWGRPIDRWLTTIHPRFGSPWIGTLLVGGVGVVCCFFPLRLLLILSGTGLLVIYAGIAVAAVAGRRTGTSVHGAYRMPLYPLAPVLTVLALGYVAWVSWLDVEEGRPALIATGVQMLLSAVYYRLVLRRRGEWRVSAP